MSYFDYKFEPDEAYAKFDLFKTPVRRTPLAIQEALEKVGITINNIELTHESYNQYPEVSIRGTLDDRLIGEKNVFTVSDFIRRSMAVNTYFINKVIFNPPATVILWADGTKTVVKCGEHDEFDPEKGLVMAITKKLLGNKGNYYNVIKNLLKEADYKYNDDDIYDLTIPRTVVKKIRYKPAINYPTAVHPESYFECPLCGDEILKSGARWCANCGQRLIWEEK